MASPYSIDENTVKEDIDEEAADALKVEKRNYKDRSIHARANLAQQKAEAKQDTLRFATDLFQKGLSAASAMKTAGAAGGGAEGAGAAGLPSGVEGAAESPDLSTKSGRIGARADDLQSRAEVAGASGRLLRQAKLTDRAAALDQRVPEMQRQELLMEQQRRAQFAEKVDDRRERAQKRLDRYNIRKEYGQDRKVGAYRADGDLYTAQPQAPDTSAEIFDPRYKASDDVVRKRALALMSQEDDLTEDEILSSMMSR